MKPSLLLFVFAALLGTSVSFASDRFESPTAGVSFTKPRTWVFASVQAAQENREKLRLSDSELEQKIKTQATPPLAVVMKHPEPYPDLNPSFQLGLRPLGALEGRSATQLLELIVPTLKAAFSDFEIVAPIAAATVGGLPAARVGIRYTLETTDGGAFPTRSDMIVVPRGKFMFFLGMGRKPDDDVAEKEQSEILESLSIQP